MKRNDWILRIAFMVTGMFIGVTVTLGIWYFKDIKKYSLPTANQDQITEFNTENFWDKVCGYYENELEVFLDNYYSIFNTYSLNRYLDNSLEPYYEKYGYEVIIKSGLQSGNKMAQAYCTEKCCELIGEEEFNKRDLLKLLENLSIDKEIITDFEEEQEYIDLAEERLALSKALLSEDFNNDNIKISPNSSRMAWVSTVLSEDYKIRIYDNGYYYTLEEPEGILPTEMTFLTNNVLKISSAFESYLVYFKENICVYSLEEEITKHLQNDTDLLRISAIDEITCQNEIAKIKYTITDYDSEESEKKSITFNLRAGQITSVK